MLSQEEAPRKKKTRERNWTEAENLPEPNRHSVMQHHQERQPTAVALERLRFAHRVGHRVGGCPKKQQQKQMERQAAASQEHLFLAPLL